MGLDFDKLDVDVCVTNPMDGSVSVLSVEVAEDSVSSIGGISSGDVGFDLAVAFGGESAYIEIQLKVSERPAATGKKTVFAHRIGPSGVMKPPRLVCQSCCY